MTNSAACLLLQARVVGPWRPIAQLRNLRFFLTQARIADPALQVRRMAWSSSVGEVYGYLQPSANGWTADAFVAAFSSACAWAQDVRASKLAQALDIQGASANQDVRFHYVVETDPEEGWADEIFRWYDTEHMPGLAAVPGCIRATRFLNHGHGPLSLACYDLTQAEALGSPPWLAVRATAWSDIARPHFTNTKRTMFEALDL